MMTGIEKHNSELKDKEKEIVGLRVYKSISPNFLFMEEPLDNVVIVPVYKNGFDVANIFPVPGVDLCDPEGLKILGNARPCPKLCSSGEFPDE